MGDEQGTSSAPIVCGGADITQDFGANGIRVGFIVSQANKPFLRAVESNSYFSCPSALADRASADLLSDAAFIDAFTATNSARLAHNYKITTTFLDANHIPYHKGSNAGFFAWVDLFPLATAAAAANTLGRYLREAPGATMESLRADEARLQSVLLEHRVFLSTGKTFGTEEPGWFRIAFAHEHAYLLEGLERVVRGTKAFGWQIAARQQKRATL